MAEFVALEVSTFIAELLKGNPKNIEPLFSDRYIYQSSSWRELVSQRAHILSERAITQYFGFISERIQLTSSQKTIQQGTQYKTLYHVRHLISISSHISLSVQFVSET
jgi:predicted nucleotidyltransferase